MPVPCVKVGNSVLVLQDSPQISPTAGVGLYARVSSHDRKPDLERQVSRLSTWAARQGQHVVRVEEEIASGMDGERPKLRRLLADPQVTTVVVEHRDRLARMNAGLVQAALEASGRSVVILDDGELDDDLVRDMTEVLTSFCARLYGQRSARSRAHRALAAAQTNPLEPTHAHGQ